MFIQNHLAFQITLWLSIISFLFSACSPSAAPAASTTLPNNGYPVPGQSQSAPVNPYPAPSQSSNVMTATIPAIPTRAAPVQLDSLPDASSANWSPFASGFVRPTYLAAPVDGSGRLFVLEQAGVIRIIQNGQLLPGPFLDIRDRVGMNGNEQGLLGMVFHPHYTQNGYFYLDYTDQNANTVIARFTVSSNPNQADIKSEKVILQIQQPFPNHKGGQLTFGPDGYLYIGMGDGGSQGDPLLNGQNRTVLLGKLLRIDVDHGDPYAIPVDNPFAKGGGRPEIWAYGLRNPWRFSFDKLTGDLYIADVGQDKWEEVDFQAAGSSGGQNYGWSFREGLHPYKGNPPAGVKFVDPVVEYGHNQGCAIIGGYVYRGKAVPGWQGVYFYGDDCSGNIWGLLHKPDGSWTSQLLYRTSAAISSFGQDENGELYMLDLNQGQIFQFSKK
ncbi:MAG TPA: PQQ-dependent sugar dehydrogenase [Anaerolineaceae bacterium]|nr:PQQ-dependent sugar dehydrogenase [Anaerolineaceae bacterium]